MRRLEAAGFEVSTGVGRTGVVGVLADGDGRTVTLRADMGALPVEEATGLPYASRRLPAGGGDGGRRAGDDRRRPLRPLPEARRHPRPARHARIQRRPVVLAAATVLRLQTIVSREVAAGQAAVVTVGALQAGTKDDVIPDEALPKVNVRTFDGRVAQDVPTNPTPASPP